MKVSRAQIVIVSYIESVLPPCPHFYKMWLYIISMWQPLYLPVKFRLKIVVGYIQTYVTYPCIHTWGPAYVIAAEKMTEHQFWDDMLHNVLDSSAGKLLPLCKFHTEHFKCLGCKLWNKRETTKNCKLFFFYHKKFHGVNSVSLNAVVPQSSDEDLSSASAWKMVRGQRPIWTIVHTVWYCPLVVLH